MDEEMKKPGMGAGTIVLVIILVAVVFGGGGYWIGTKNTKSTIPTGLLTATATGTVPTAATGTATATDETAGWKTYTNDKFGFSFKYPSGWTATATNDNAVELKQNGKKYYVEGTEVTPITANLELNGASDSTALEIANSRKLKTNIGSPEVKSYSLSGFDASRETNYLATTTYVKLSNGNLFTLTQVNDGVENNQKNLNTISDQILSTFQFTK